MKKILALILSALMLLSLSAVAEETTNGWHVVIDEIEITTAGETIALNASLEGVLGYDGTTLWGEGSVLLGAEKILTIQGTFANDEAIGTLEGAQDAMSLSGINELANMLLVMAADEGVETPETVDLTIYIPMLFSLIGDTSWIDQLAPELPALGMNLEVRGERDYALSYAFEGDSFKVHFAWNPVVTAAPDFSAKNIVVLDPFAEELPETDLKLVAVDALAKLLADPTVAQIVNMASTLEGELTLDPAA